MGVGAISTGELLDAPEGGDRIVLDLRPLAAYNGWALRDEPRGGHIRGARTFPSEWFEHDAWPELLRGKGVGPDTHVIVYGYEAGAVAPALERLESAGCARLGRFDGFLDWSADADLPLDRLPRYRRLVYPDWVRTLVAGGDPPTHDGSDVVICHASYRYRGDYEAGHIPGAIHLDTETLESEADWNRRSPGELRRACLDLGIRRDSTVVLYGRFSHPNNEDEYPGRLAGHLAAMRCAQLLLYAGVEDIRILNGGMRSWLAAGHEVSTAEGEVRPVADFGGDVPARAELIVDTPGAKELLASPAGELVSVRSWEEFIGDVSGYNYIDKVGRIPGAVFGNCGSDAYHMENYRHVDHTLREYHEIAGVWAASGITPDKHIAFYCGTGWRASEAFMHAYTMGWPRISVYDGGWMEWSSDPDNPVATGPPAWQRPRW